MKEIVKKQKRAAAGVVLLALVLLCCTGCGHQEEENLQTLSLEENEAEKSTGKQAEAEDAEGDTETGEEKTQEKAKAFIFVHVCGAVQSPGVYELKNGSRIYEAVALAGGIREDAAGEFVNQAQVLKDGEQVYIPTEEEVQTKTLDAAPGAEAVKEEGTDNSGKVNLNTASEEELMTLNGIGETRARSILEYRETNGGFQTIEDLMQVEGIKEGVFDKIKDRITVNTGS